VNKRSVGWPAAAWILIICLATAIVYGPSLRFFFSQDDFVFLARAAAINSWQDLVRTFLAPDHFYRPVPRIILFLAQWRLFGLNAAAFHLVSVGLHALNASLLFLLCRRLFGRARMAGLAGLLYATHHVPFLAVYWVSGIQDLVATTFLLGSLHLYLRSVAMQHAGWRALSLAAYGLALLSKEIAVTFPFLLVLVAYVDSLRAGRRPRLDTLAAHGLSYGAFLVVYLVIRSQKAASQILGEGPYAWSLDPGTGLGNLYTYLCDALYVRDWIGTAPGRAAGVCTLFVAALLITFWFSRRDRWVITVGVGWFLIALSPVLFLSQRAYSFYAYFPLAGIVMALSALICLILDAIRLPSTSTTLPFREAKGVVLSLLLMVWLWFSAAQVRAMEVKDPAGIISKSVLARRAATEVQALYPTLAEGSTLLVVGLTERDVWALGHGDLFRLYYPQAEVVLRTGGQEDQADAVERGTGYVYDFGGGE
jgi:hypothetical protein